MAESIFQFAPEGPLSRGSLGASAASPTLGIRGGESPGLDDAGRFLRGASPDLSGGVSLPMFLDPLFEPKIKAEMAKRENQGYVDALMGKSMEDINKESPWYTKVFGPVPYQLGAAKYQVDKQSADAASYFTREMPRLREMPTEEVARELQGKLAQQVSDDPYTTVLLQKSFRERMPGMIDLHTRERYAWEQTELVKKQGEADQSVASAFSDMRRKYAELGDSGPNEVSAGYNKPLETQNLLRNLALSEHIADDTEATIWKNRIRTFAENGNFDVLAVLAESGLEEAMGVEEAARARTYVDQKWGEFKQNALLQDPEMMERRVRINLAAQQGVGAEPTWAAMAEFDQEFQAKYGYKGYFEAGDKERLGTASGSAWISDEERRIREIEAEQKRLAREAKSEEDKVAAAAEKERLRSQTLTLSAEAFLSGQKALLDSSTTLPSEDRELVVTTAFDRVSATNPSLAAQVLVWNHAALGTPSTGLTTRFRQQLDNATGGPINDAYRSTFALWEALYSGKAARIDPATKTLQGEDTLAGKAAALAYFGADNHARMLEYSRLRQANMPDDLAYNMSWGESREARPTIQGATAEETKRLRSSFKEGLDDYAPTLWSRLTGAPRLTASGRAELAAFVSGPMSQLGMIANPDLRVKYAIKYARDNGKEINGRYLWDNAPRQQTTAQYLGRHPDVAADVVDRTITAKILKSTGINVSDDTQMTAVRALDRGGVPVIRVAILDNAAKWSVVEVSGEDMRATLRADATPPEQKPREQQFSTRFLAR